MPWISPSRLTTRLALAVGTAATWIQTGVDNRDKTFSRFNSALCSNPFQDGSCVAPKHGAAPPGATLFTS